MALSKCGREILGYRIRIGSQYEQDLSSRSFRTGFWGRDPIGIECFGLVETAFLYYNLDHAYTRAHRYSNDYPTECFNAEVEPVT